MADVSPIETIHPYMFSSTCTVVNHLDKTPAMLPRNCSTSDLSVRRGGPCDCQSSLSDVLLMRTQKFR